MNRPLTTLFAALEALLVVGIGIGIPLVPLTFLWAFSYGLQIDWMVFWRASVDIWLLGHGTDIRVTLDPITATLSGLPDAGESFIITIAALGFALLTVLLGHRAGRRIAETPHHRLGLVVATATFGLLALVVTVSTLNEFARPSIWQGVLWPTLVFTIGLAIGHSSTIRKLGRMPGARRQAPLRFGRLGAWWTEAPPLARAIVPLSLRGGAAAVAGVLACSAVILTTMIVVNYAKIISLYEGIHSELLGGIALTVGELALLPNLVIWVGSWLVGPGFAIGTGSSVGPLGTSLGPIPAIPVLGALPVGDLAFGFLGLLVPILVGFLVGVALRNFVVAEVPGYSQRMALAATGIGVGIVGGVAFGILAAASGGSAGPGRLMEVGPNPWLIGLFAALEFGIPALLGLLASGRKAQTQ